MGWYAGVMFWQYSSDKKGLAATLSTYQLESFYRRNPIQPKH